MRVVFLFVSKGGAPYNSNPDWRPDHPCTSNHCLPEGLPTEGTFHLLDKLQSNGVIDELFIVFEAARGSGKAQFGRHNGMIVPELSQLSQFLRPDDVLFVRGGWRGWWEWLNDRQGEHWLINYSANTGRQRWKFWDVVLWDLEDICMMDRLNRFWITFRKPVNTDIFYDRGLFQVYDLLVGASFIHDKKGQFRIINVLKEFEKLFKYVPSCIIPGALRGSTHTNHQLINQAPSFNIDFPGMLSREELAVLMNRSKIGVFLGSSGQNDRGPLEAMACGCPLIIGSPRYHSPVVYENEEVSWVPNHIDDYKGIAIKLHELLENYTKEMRYKTIEWNNRVSTSYEDLKTLFGVIRENPKPNPEALRREYGI